MLDIIFLSYFYSFRNLICWHFILLEKQFTINFCCESHQDLYYYNPEDLAPLFEQQDNDEDVKAARKEDTNDEGETHFPFNVQFRPEVGR